MYKRGYYGAILTAGSHQSNICADTAITELVNQQGMRGSRKFCQRGSNFDVFCLVDELREDLSNTIRGPSFKWRFAGVPMMAQH